MADILQIAFLCYTTAIMYNQIYKPLIYNKQDNQNLYALTLT